MRNLSNFQFGLLLDQEKKVRKRGLLNSGYGFVGNGFWWSGYPTYASSESGYGGYMTTAQNPPVSDSGSGASITGDASGSVGAGDGGGSGGY